MSDDVVLHNLIHDAGRRNQRYLINRFQRCQFKRITQVHDVFEPHDITPRSAIVKEAEDGMSQLIMHTRTIGRRSSARIKMNTVSREVPKGPLEIAKGST